ncbi:MAG TPA: FKBP-type peptidyl-prolyl cis-trans isomerase [Ferruginibacter sp.]|nr:FKBP-type peptidyl-prolyl cis-trans isomerase [Ferruginibacter sp.]
MNRKILFILALSAAPFIFGSCNKADPSYTQNNCVPNNTGIPTADEIASLQAYLSSNSITATLDSRGFFYQVINPGSGPTPTLASTISFKYVGTLQSGVVFDQVQAPVTYPLAQLIKGWQYGLPLIQKGGTIKLYLPPTLGYGCGSPGGIPPGSNLIFNIELTDVN